MTPSRHRCPKCGTPVERLLWAAEYERSGQPLLIEVEPGPDHAVVCHSTARCRALGRL